MEENLERAERLTQRLEAETQRANELEGVQEDPSTHRLQQKVEDLRQQLREAEVEEALQKMSATMHGVTSDSENQKCIDLGSVVYAEVKFEGRPVQALIDTGSPATIVSLEFALQALADQRRPDQSPSDWELEMTQKLQQPAIRLHSYGGEQLNIVRQLTATIQSGMYSKTAVVLVQSNAPTDLLLGTDCQPHLGFQLLQTSSEGPAVDLLLEKPRHCEQDVREDGGLGDGRAVGGAEDQEAESPEDKSEGPRKHVAVRLLQAMRLPAQHARMVRARVEEPLRETLRIFEPSDILLQETGLMIEEGVVETDRDHLITLVVQNQSPSTVHLPEERVLGELQVATVLPEERGSDVLVREGCSELNADSEVSDDERTKTLWEALNLGKSR